MKTNLFQHVYRLTRSKPLGSLWLFSIICLVTFMGCKESDRGSSKLRIAVASNMQFAIAEISDVFTKETGIPCELIISSSGKLTAQIIEGAPYDVFISADEKYPQELYRSGLTQTPPKIYAAGKLVLYTINADLPVLLDSLVSKEIKHIAIANPETAPYGLAASEVLNNSGLYDSVKRKLVYGESISQVNQFITSGAADIGITAMGVVLSTRLQNNGQWREIRSTLHEPINQAAVILNQNEMKTENAAIFFNFLFSEKSEQILNKFKYSTHE